MLRVFKLKLKLPSNRSSDAELYWTGHFGDVGLWWPGQRSASFRSVERCCCWQPTLEEDLRQKCMKFDQENCYLLFTTILTNRLYKFVSRFQVTCRGIKCPRFFMPRKWLQSLRLGMMKRIITCMKKLVASSSNHWRYNHSIIFTI